MRARKNETNFKKLFWVLRQIYPSSINLCVCVSLVCVCVCVAGFESFYLSQNILMSSRN